MLWLLTNSAWMLIDIRARLFSQAFLFLVYVGLSVWGIVRWSK